MNNIIDFLKNDIRGLIILAVVSSLIAALLYDSFKKLYNKLIEYRQSSKKKNLMSKIMKSYSEGFTAAFALDSSYKQTVLTGHYIIQIIIQTSIVLLLTILFVASLILIGQPFSWIITMVFSIVLTLQYRRLKELREKFLLFMETIFGEEFKELVKKHAIEHAKKKFETKK